MQKSKVKRHPVLPINNPTLTRAAMVLSYLTAIYHSPGQTTMSGASSALLSREFGIRNVPDVIMKLRRQGHDIQTRIVHGVNSGLHKYPTMAVYHLASLDDLRSEVMAANFWETR